MFGSTHRAERRRLKWRNLYEMNMCVHKDFDTSITSYKTNVKKY